MIRSKASIPIVKCYDDPVHSYKYELLNMFMAARIRKNTMFLVSECSPLPTNPINIFILLNASC
jgi:hypothetical protein